ncbi:coiled-coil domain-containing protein [Nonomuraea sp. NPDC050556]|uniref:coiled-coil domain-containing protein n=1 Tax=Nonomuraea sp. NPDC050556 TaxID=3364369 RepID=UPI0037B7E276
MTFPRVVACGVLAAVTLALSPAGTAAAAPKPTEKQLRAELSKLNTKVDKLIETYNAKRVALAKAKKAEQSAKERLAAADKTLADTQTKISQMAAMAYQGGDPGLASMMWSPNIGGRAVLDQLNNEQEAILAGVTAARAAKKQAVDEAAELTEQIKDDTDEVAGQREDAEDVIKDIEKKLNDLVPYGTGRRSDGSWAPELPSGDDNITPRMRQVRDLIKKDFNLPFEVGCYRVDDHGEHPLGRACDFMMSSGGSMPSAANNALGDQIAAWAMKNKDKLGVKYVIWKQRIDQGSGWRGMSDRGGITANHYDHVHISMY